MTRAEMRRQKRESEKEHTITYNLTKAQLDQMVNSLVQKQISEAKREAADEAINTALALFLGLPLCVLMDEYWKKSYTQKLPGESDGVRMFNFLIDVMLGMLLICLMVVAVSWTIKIIIDIWRSI